MMSTEVIPTLMQLVLEALNNAKDNGYDFTNKEPQWIVDDLREYCGDLEQGEWMDADILPCVIAWQQGVFQ